jgi:hypothetical protein
MSYNFGAIIKNYIPLFQESLPEGYPRHPPPLRKLPPRMVDGKVRFTGATFTCRIHSREGGGLGNLQNDAIR